MRIVHALVPLPVIAATGIAINATACGDAPQSPSGGDPQFDAHVDPAITADAGDAGEGGCITNDASDVTWTALYADLFGPASLGQCGDATRTGSATTSCHHDGTGNGAISSGFVCGDTQESCYQGITSPNAQFAGEQVVLPCAPGNSFLPDVMRHDGGGLMPFYPETVVFSDSDIARVRAWIAAGALEN